MMLSNDVDFDLYGVGFVELVDGVPHLIHVTHDTGLVTVDPYPAAAPIQTGEPAFLRLSLVAPQE